ncbi:MAG TPA: choice-of-anchor Q domain-containing protein [Phycisphaerae bacterium]|jgi:parallel beta-helix repeat protein|nr:right-handed parallel beta-helix repeat-containing protein [Phycisphaerae bacterium]HOB75243.1 choice-of-anchor Q domain-containing protein [Phycisphaerae bacterium]HOJ54724.1 choice-of-anchor Q domain-containing protein [Phycisphaerae bacterium]HOL25925.1 choice-of-anchor Q domain-containing protein [Phycisphaerae bacterium]HPP19502.1 choice-of-anchor Q domain-containing protein [Phycisphaerae bacterium]
MQMRNMLCATGIALLLMLQAGCPADEGAGDTTDDIQSDGTGGTPDGANGDQQGGPGNGPPGATALAITTSGDLNLTLGQQGTVTGIVSGGTPPITYSWQQISGPAATITNPNSPIATVSSDLPGIIVLRLTVTDAAGTAGSADVTITVTAPLLSPGVLVVRQGATGANNGTTWFDAFTNLQDALAAARVPGSGIREIWVAAGVYKPAGPGGLRTTSFALVDNVAVYGGFAGAETHFAQRDLAANATVLSGDLNNNDRNNFGNRDDNSEHVVTAEGLGSGTILDGFTISGGNATTSPGGGLAVVNSSIIVRNCSFIDNSATSEGGGASLSNSSGTVLTNCTFRFNQSLSTGGGLTLRITNALISDSNFLDNVALDAGGIWISGGNSTLTNCLIARNIAQNAAGLRNAADSLVLTNCTIENNSAGSGQGGGIVATTPLTATNCIFSENHAGQGGGINASADNVSLLGCLFERNTATTGAGALLSGAAATLINCTVSGNTATGFGGGLRLVNPVWSVKNCILWGNVDVNGSIESAQISLAGMPSSLNQMMACDVQGLALFAARNDNIDADPLFVDPASGNLRLQADSPCIGAGYNSEVPASLTTDLDGRPRIQGTPPVVDMGAYER